MISIPGISQLAAYDRRQAQMAGRSTAVESGARSASPPSERANPAAAGPAAARAGVAEIVGARVAMIDASHPGAPRLAFRAYLEVVLRSELAAQIEGHDALYGLVDRVWHDMESDAALSQAMDSAGASLLRRAAAARDTPRSQDG